MTPKETILQDISMQLDTMPDFGQLQIYIKAHLGQIGKADMVKMTTTKYTDNDPNVSVTTDIYRMIKAMADAGVTGSLGFSINFKHGQAETLQVQDFKRL